MKTGTANATTAGRLVRAGGLWRITSAAMFIIGLSLAGCGTGADEMDPGGGEAAQGGAVGNTDNGAGGGSQPTPDGGPTTQPPPPAQQNPATVSESLAKLGVSTAETPRVDENGDALPDDYSPLGTEHTVAQIDEKQFIKIELADGAVLIPMSDDKADDVKSAFNKLIVRVKKGEFQVKLEGLGEDLFSQVANVYSSDFSGHEGK